MKRRTSSASVVSPRTARCRLRLLDPASKEEVARWISATRRCGGVDGGVLPRAGLRQAVHEEEEEEVGEGAARVIQCPTCAAPLLYL